MTSENSTVRLEEPAQAAGTRHGGIELLRCVSMVLVLILHILGQGGVLSAAPADSPQFRTAWFLETAAYCAVDCYALISGYVNKSKELKIRKLVLMWLQVVFLLVLPLLAARAFFPSVELTSDDAASAFLPLTKKTLWYFNAYALLFPFIPILNAGLEKIGKKQYIALMGVLFVTSSCLHVLNGGDDFILSNGYCGMWIIILYVFGAYFRIHGIPKRAKWYFTLPLFFVSAAAAWAGKMMQSDLVRAGRIDKNGKIFAILGRFVNFTSPFVVIMAICLLLLFARMKIKSSPAGKIIAFWGKCSFGVYLFHVGPIVWEHFMRQRFKTYSLLPPALLVLRVLLMAIALFFVFGAVSAIQQLIFRYCGINRLVGFLADRLNARIGRKKEETE